MFPIKILEEGAIIGHLFSIYQAGQFGLKSRWVVLYPWKNVSSFLFSGHLPLRKLARNFCRSWPELSWARTLAREFPLPKRFPRVQIQFQWENTDLDSSRQRTSSILKGGEGGAGNWSVRPRRRDEILGRCLPSRCPSRIDVLLLGVSKGQSG